VSAPGLPDIPERLVLLTDELCGVCASPLRAFRKVWGVSAAGFTQVSAPLTACPKCDMALDLLCGG
jgi:hypothetical protein